MFENQQSPRSNRLLSRRCRLLAILMCIVIPGCKPSESNDGPGNRKPPQVSDIPLRVWAVANVQNPEVIRRKWLATSSQPIDLKVLTTEEFLNLDRCACDVVVLPMRLLGEVTQRNWLSKLPVGLQAGEKGGESAPTFPRAMMAQAEYGGEQIAIPLGISVPTLIASGAFAASAEPEQAMTWESILGQLSQAETLEIDHERLDLEAVADRFLALLATLSTRNSKYGKLLELKTLEPLINSEEFVQAANLLMTLAKQTQDGVLACGSHSAVFEHITASEKVVISLAVVNALTESAATSKGGAVLKQLPVVGPEEPAGTRFWNTGSGLVAALGADCSQSMQATEFLQWLAKDTTRNDIASQIAGIDVSAPVFGVDSLSWKATQRLRRIYDSVDLPQELRLPAAQEYRKTLATELVKFLEGKQSDEDALRQTAKLWEAISQRPNQAEEYSKSLGLVF